MLCACTRHRGPNRHTRQMCSNHMAYTAVILPCDIHGSGKSVALLCNSTCWNNISRLHRLILLLGSRSLCPWMLPCKKCHSQCGQQGPRKDCQQVDHQASECTVATLLPKSQQGMLGTAGFMVPPCICLQQTSGEIEGYLP